MQLHFTRRSYPFIKNKKKKGREEREKYDTRKRKDTKETKAYEEDHKDRGQLFKKPRDNSAKMLRVKMQRNPLPHPGNPIQYGPSRGVPDVFTTKDSSSISAVCETLATGKKARTPAWLHCEKRFDDPRRRSHPARLCTYDGSYVSRTKVDLLREVFSWFPPQLVAALPSLPRLHLNLKPIPRRDPTTHTPGSPSSSLSQESGPANLLVRFSRPLRLRDPEDRWPP